jgi:hypothetical protein
MDNLTTIIAKFIKVHGNKYLYNKVNYKGALTKVTIICKIHGEFEQTPSNHHSQKNGCKQCANKRKLGNKNSTGGWTYTNWKKAGSKSKKFDSYKVYIIRCFNGNEEFFKIGKTFLKVSHRFDGKHAMPYEYEVIKTIEGSARFISELEVTLQKDNKNNKYVPLNKFAGMQECFSNNELLKY